jgi:hypothetical protein
MPFSGRTGVEGSAVNPRPGGVMEDGEGVPADDVGVPLPLPWSRGAKPVP